MKIFNIFCYRITIRKQAERKPHPMDTQNYHRKLQDKRRAVKRALYEEIHSVKNNGLYV